MFSSSSAKINDTKSLTLDIVVLPTNGNSKFLISVVYRRSDGNALGDFSDPLKLHSHPKKNIILFGNSSIIYELPVSQFTGKIMTHRNMNACNFSSSVPGLNHGLTQIVNSTQLEHSQAPLALVEKMSSLLLSDSDIIMVTIVTLFYGMSF